MNELLEMLMLKDLNKLGKIYFFVLILIFFMFPCFITILMPLALLVLVRLVVREYIKKKLKVND